MKTYQRLVAAGIAACSFNASAAVITVSDIQDTPSATEWGEGDTRDNGAYDIVDLTGMGGNLESGVPLGSGALWLNTGLSNNDKAEIALVGDFGAVSDIFNSDFSISYDFYRSNVDGGNTFAAPSLKLAFYNDNCGTGEDCYFQAVYEQYWNTPVVSDTWTSVMTSLNDGCFWQTGGFGLSSDGAACPSTQTLSTIQGNANGNFASARLVGIAIGLGTYNQGVTSYVDNVSINVGQYSNTFDFEAADVSEPALPLLLSSALFGMFLYRRKK